MGVMQGGRKGGRAQQAGQGGRGGAGRLMPRRSCRRGLGLLGIPCLQFPAASWHHLLALMTELQVEHRCCCDELGSENHADPAALTQAGPLSDSEMTVCCDPWLPPYKPVQARPKDAGEPGHASPHNMAMSLPVILLLSQVQQDYVMQIHPLVSQVAKGPGGAHMA